MNNPSIPLSVLIQARIEAKRAEEAAIAARREVDAVIADRLATEGKIEGSVTERAEGWKVTVTYGVNRRVATEQLQADWSKLSAEVQAVFRWKAEPIATELRKLEGRAAISAAKYVTTSPATPTVRIEAV